MPHRFLPVTHPLKPYSFFLSFTRIQSSKNSSKMRHNKKQYLESSSMLFSIFSASLIKYGLSTFNIIQLFLGYQATDKVWTSLIMPLRTFCSLKRSLISIRNTFSILFFTKSLENPEQFYFYWLDNTYQHSLQIWSF